MKQAQLNKKDWNFQEIRQKGRTQFSILGVTSTNYFCRPFVSSQSVYSSLEHLSDLKVVTKDAGPAGRAEHLPELVRQNVVPPSLGRYLKKGEIIPFQEQQRSNVFFICDVRKISRQVSLSNLYYHFMKKMKVDTKKKRKSCGSYITKEGKPYEQIET